MTFDYTATEQQILDRLTPAAASAGVPLYRDEDVVDLTDSNEIPIGAQVVFLDLVPAEQIGRSARYLALWAFDLYLDPKRATPAQKSAASALFSNAITQLIGQDITPGREIRAAKVDRSGNDGRIRRRSFGFTTPVHLAG